MAYLSAKKIYPGDMTEPLNGWYKNIDTNYSDSNDASVAGPTSVLANPGWQFYQMRGYVKVTTATGDGYTQVSRVTIPSPYKNDDTRTDITGLVVTGDTERPAYVYRTAISVAKGWGDGRVAEDGLTTSGAAQVIGFGPGTASAPVSFSGVVEGANLTGANLEGVESDYILGLPLSLPDGWSLVDGTLIEDKENRELSDEIFRGINEGRANKISKWRAWKNENDPQVSKGKTTFKNLDKNNNGKISSGEFFKFYKRWIQD